jgi:thiol-disulfide isomerase/thioredoxin
MFYELLLESVKSLLVRIFVVNSMVSMVFFQLGNGHNIKQSYTSDFKLGYFEKISYRVKVTSLNSDKDTLVLRGEVFATFDAQHNLVKVRLNTTNNFDIIYTTDIYLFVNHNKKTVVSHDVNGFNQDNYSIIGNQWGRLTLPLIFISDKNPIPELLANGFQLNGIDEHWVKRWELVAPELHEESGEVKFWMNDSLGFFSKIEERTEFEGVQQYMLWEFDAVNTPNYFHGTTFSAAHYDYHFSTYQQEGSNLNLNEGDEADWLISFIIENLDHPANATFQNAQSSEIFVIDFWFQNCFPCRQAMPILESVHKKYGNHLVHVVGMNPIDKQEDEKVKQLLKKLNITYPSLYGLEKARFDCNAYPTLFIVDNGVVVFKEVGFSEELDQVLDEQIKNRLLLRE